MPFSTPVSSTSGRPASAGIARPYLNYWATAFDPELIPYWDVRDEFITVIGNVALVRSTNKSIRRRDGNEATGMTTYTDTYLLENGAWKCIQAQIQAVAPEHYPVR